MSYLTGAIHQQGRETGHQSIGPRHTTGSQFSIPSPIKGLNSNDNILKMKPEYAVELNNFFPAQGSVELRKGYSEFANVGTDTVNTIFNHINKGNDKLYAFAGTGIYDITSGGTVGTSEYTIVSDKFHVVNFNGFGIGVSGEDTPIKISDTDIEVLAITGITTPASLNYVLPFKNRLYFVEKDSSSFWYLPVKAIQGAASEFNLAFVYPDGGNIVALGTLTLDGGQGVDDMFAVMMSTGTVIIYSGTDPSSVTAWSLVGIFKIGRPVGNRPFVKLGGDLIVMTEDGFVPLLQFIKFGSFQKQLALSNKINNLVNYDVRTFGNHYGWQSKFYSNAGWLLFNIPNGTGLAHQYVMNSITGAWCKFTNMNALCWETFVDKLCFGAKDGKVFRANHTDRDDGNPIKCSLQTAYNYVRSHEDKRFTLCRPNIRSLGNTGAKLSVGY